MTLALTGLSGLSGLMGAGSGGPPPPPPIILDFIFSHDYNSQYLYLLMEEWLM